MERIGDLHLERTRTRGSAKPLPLLFVHGMWLGSWCWENRRWSWAPSGIRSRPWEFSAGSPPSMTPSTSKAAGHGHMLMLEEGWEQSFKEILTWIDRAIAEEPRA